MFNLILFIIVIVIALVIWNTSTSYSGGSIANRATIGKLYETLRNKDGSIESIRIFNGNYSMKIDEDIYSSHNPKYTVTYFNDYFKPTKTETISDEEINNVIDDFAPSMLPFTVNKRVKVRLINRLEQGYILGECRTYKNIIEHSNKNPTEHCDVKYKKLYRVWSDDEKEEEGILVGVLENKTFYHQSNPDKFKKQIQDKSNIKFSSRNGWLYTHTDPIHFNRESLGGGAGGTFQLVAKNTPILVVVNINPPVGGDRSDAQTFYKNKYGIDLDGVVGCLECEVAFFGNRVHDVLNTAAVTPYIQLHQIGNPEKYFNSSNPEKPFLYPH